MSKSSRDRLIEALMRDERRVEIEGIEIDLTTYKLETLKTYARKRELEAIKVADEIIQLILS